MSCPDLLLLGSDVHNDPGHVNPVPVHHHGAVGETGELVGEVKPAVRPDGGGDPDSLICRGQVS